MVNLPTANQISLPAKTVRIITWFGIQKQNSQCWLETCQADNKNFVDKKGKHSLEKRNTLQKKGEWSRWN